MEHRGAGRSRRLQQIGLAAAPAAVWLALHGIGLLDPARWWGVALLSYYPVTAAVALFGVPAIIAVAPWHRLAGSWRDRALRLTEHRAFPAALALAALALFTLARVRAHTLGDSAKWFAIVRNAVVRQVDFDDIAWHNAALHIPGLEFINFQQAGDLLVHYVVFAIGHALGGWQPETAYAVVSIAAGGAYVVVLWGLARRLSDDPLQALAAFGVFVSLGTVQLFCGYGESYTLVTLLQALYLCVAVDTLRGRAPLWHSAAVLAVAAVTHFLALALAPSWLWLAWRDPALGPRLRRPWIAGPLVGLGIVGGVVFYLAFYRGLHLPLWQADAAGRYAILSAEHAWTWLNQLLLLSPFGLVWGLAGLWDRRPDAERTALGLAALGPGLLLGVHDIIMGGRDWDLMSFYALPLAAWGFVALRHRAGTSTAGLLGRWILPLSLLHTGLWVGINADNDRAQARLEHLLVHTNQVAHYRHWVQGYYHMHHTPPDLARAEAAFARAVAEAPPEQLDTPGTREFSYRKFQAAMASRLGHHQRALELIRQVHELEPQPNPPAVDDIAIYWEWAVSAHNLALAAYERGDRWQARQLWQESRLPLLQLMQWRDDPVDAASLQRIDQRLAEMAPPAASGVDGSDVPP